MGRLSLNPMFPKGTSLRSEKHPCLVFRQSPEHLREVIAEEKPDVANTWPVLAIEMTKTVIPGKSGSVGNLRFSDPQEDISVFSIDCHSFPVDADKLNRR
jgi:hypothetical protein